MAVIQFNKGFRGLLVNQAQIQVGVNTVSGFASNSMKNALMSQKRHSLSERYRTLNCNKTVPDFHKRNLFSDEAHFWLNGYVSKQNCRIWSEANPQVYVETPYHPEKLTVWCALWAGGILLQKR
ncbi:putative DD41D transposase [Trichonephila clavipes]|nr:putative DD41D transposase [Trichonephila clavipes]